MPKKKGSSKSATGSCISSLVRKGYPQRQAVAIAMNKGKKGKKRKK